MAEPATAFEPTDDDALTRAIAEARAQVASGQTIPLRDVADWLDSWGTADERPAPSCK
ncbi:antitoxin [Azospirillum melinis]|uniref:Antitoxin n=1 Tax=Azospirillum melinis TaxID=328839 RepID=A0ABX2KVH2_9PROT|nr:antitoxin [Azospirillum melinis]MBP2309450.1 putative transcriptional regulator [Azospirillum melinis]NUB04537.1 antitoxin [Azospirillum melinis]